MKGEFDVSTAERGRLFRPDAAIVPPTHLEADVSASLPARPEARHVSLDEVVATLLSADIDPIAAAR